MSDGSRPVSKTSCIKNSLNTGRAPGLQCICIGCGCFSYEGLSKIAHLRVPIDPAASALWSGAPAAHSNDRRDRSEKTIIRCATGCLRKSVRDEGKHLQIAKRNARHNDNLKRLIIAILIISARNGSFSASKEPLARIRLVATGLASSHVGSADPSAVRGEKRFPCTRMCFSSAPCRFCFRAQRPRSTVVPNRRGKLAPTMFIGTAVRCSIRAISRCWRASNNIGRHSPWAVARCLRIMASDRPISGTQHGERSRASLVHSSATSRDLPEFLRVSAE
jgi:hypothetical protein